MTKKRFIQLPSIEKYSSRKEWEAACWQIIAESKDILKLFVTPHEYHRMVMRVAGMQELLAGTSYREIGKKHWLSPQTISMLRKTADENNYKSYSERGKKERRRRPDTVPRYRRESGAIMKRTKYGRVRIP